MNDDHHPTPPGLHLTRLVLATIAALLAPPHPATPQAPPATPPPLDLATLYDLGHLLLDENGDGVPDRLGATLVLAPEPTTAERAAAAEIAARLGFETMALDLPIRRGVWPGRVGILIGHGALDPLGLSPADFGVHTPAPGTPPTVGTLTTASGDRWVAVLGGDDTALLRAARFLAGSLPHIRSLSGPSIADVGEEINEWLAAGDSMAPSAAFSYPRVSVDGPGDDVHLIAELRFVADPEAETPIAAGATDSLTADALERLGALARGIPDPDADSTEAASTDLRFRSLATVTVSGGGFQVELPALSPSSPSGGRPGGGGGTPNLADLYRSGGFLGGGDIPNSVNVIVVPGEGAEGVPELAARLGLETTGLTVPLVKTTDEIESPAREPTMVLVGSDHPFIAELADSGKIALDELPPGHGLIELVPDAFGSRSAVVVTGSDQAGATMATRRLAEIFPGVSEWADGNPTFDDIEQELWGTLSGYTPGGQAAIGLYRLDRIVAGLADEDIASADILVSAEKAPAGLADVVRERAAALGTENITVTIDNRDVQTAATIFDDQFEVPSEVDGFWDAFEGRVLPGLTSGAPVHLHARLSEPPEIRQAVADEARRRLIAAGADPDAATVEVLSAFKQGFFWLRESVAPRLAGHEVGEVVIEFLRNDPPGEWPQQAMQTPLRWLHEIFPIDEILVADLGLELGQIRFEMVEDGPIYRVRATAPDGDTLLEETFDPVWVLRPYVDRFRDYEHVRVTTGWITATSGADTLAHERIVTDPEWFWDRFQAESLPAVYDYVMQRHEGNPRPGRADQPYFGTLTVELELSEPDYRLGVDNEIISTMDALHEEIYFGTIEFFQLLGRNSRGAGLSYPGRIIPVMRPKGDGGAGRGHITFTGFATDRPTVIVRYERTDGTTGEERLDIPKISMERPSLRRIVVGPAGPRSILSRLDFRLRVDSEFNQRDSLLILATADAVDARMISAEQIAATLANLGDLRDAGLYGDALAYHEVGEIGVRAYWTHESTDSTRTTAVLAANGAPQPLPVWTDLLPDGWEYAGDRIVQWDTPIPPPEGHEMTAKMSHAFDHATMYRVGESYLGRTTWAMDLMSPVTTTHWSRTKATTFKPTVIYSAREHANEVSSTSHVLRHAELLLTDPEQMPKLDKVNVVIHPFTNPDGAQLAYDLFQITPDYILHAGYLGSLGVNVTAGGGFPIYPESRVRRELWERWRPDIFLNPHGYPSHQVVQLFSEYSGLVRSGRVTERNWGMNKGWFMPGFGYIDDPAYPLHKDAAFKIRDYITAGINSNRDVFEMNQRNYDRYRRYGASFDSEVFRLPMTDSVLIEMPLKGSRGPAGAYNPRITIWSGITEAPDETAYGPWMELVAKAGLSWDQAILDYLHDGDHKVNRSGSAFRGGATLRMNRPRPPEKPEEEEEEEEDGPP